MLNRATSLFVGHDVQYINCHYCNVNLHAYCCCKLLNIEHFVSDINKVVVTEITVVCSKFSEL